jgi:hypothetical protein
VEDQREGWVQICKGFPNLGKYIPFFFFFVGATYLKDQHILDSENLPSFRGQLEPLEHLFFNLTKCRQPSKFKPKSILRC